MQKHNMPHTSDTVYGITCISKPKYSPASFYHFNVKVHTKLIEQERS